MYYSSLKYLDVWEHNDVAHETELHPPEITGEPCWILEWTKWKIGYDNRVSTTNYKEHITITRGTYKMLWRKKREQKKNPVLNIYRHFHKGRNVRCLLKKK